MNEIKNKFSELCWGLSKINDEWIYQWDLLDDKEENYDIFKNKFLNLLNKLNENDSDILKMDIEKEIWNIV